jgi:SAM-dependent methyltransferase
LQSNSFLGFILPRPGFFRPRHEDDSENQGTQALFMSCVICDEPRYWRLPFAQNPDVTRWRAEAGDDAEYEWRLCRRCGNAYPSHQPRLAVLQRIWNASRSDDCLTTDAKDTAWSYRRAISQVGATRSFRLFAPLAVDHPRRFIDIGCGLGETVRIFADNGWDAEGVDADPSTARFHRELGIRVRIGQLEQTEATTEYDLIHIAHAIYFITDPMAFIRGVRARLRPGGLFCIVLADLMANTDPTLPSYVHTFFPTASSMRYALSLAGFETIFCRRLSGSIFMAARPAPSVARPFVSPVAIRMLYRTKSLRYALFGRPYILLARAIKSLLGRS